MKQHGIFVFTSPSCSGKSTMEARMNDTGLFSKTISVTTRPMRPGEVDGVDYHFISKERFQELQKTDQLVESVNFNNNFYGVTKEEFQRHVDLGKHTLVVCEPHGAEQYRNYALENGLVPVNIFVSCPLEVCSSRFFARLQGEDFLDAEGNIDQEIITRYAERFSAMSLEEQDWVNQIDYDIHTRPMVDYETAKEFADQLIYIAKQMDEGEYDASGIHPATLNRSESIIPQAAIDKNIRVLSGILNNALAKDYNKDAVGSLVIQTREVFLDKMTKKVNAAEQVLR